MFAVASNLFGKSSSLSAYTLHTTLSPSPSSSSTNLPSTSAASSASTKALTIGLWKVVGATHKTTGKDVSVWVFEKRLLDGIKGSKEWVLEQLKKEASRAFRPLQGFTLPCFASVALAMGADNGRQRHYHDYDILISSTWSSRSKTLAQK